MQIEDREGIPSIRSVGEGLLDNSRQRDNGDYAKYARDSRVLIKVVTKKLRTILRRHAEASLKSRIIDRSNLDRFSKLSTSILATQTSTSSTPLASAPDMIPSRGHTAAVVSCFDGEFFLGRYAGNGKIFSTG